MNFRERPLHETNLLLVWLITASVSAVLIVVELTSKLTIRLGLVPWPSFTLSSWTLSLGKLLELAPLFAFAVIGLPAIATILTLFVLRARRVAFSSRYHGSFTVWWGNLKRRTSGSHRATKGR